MRKLVAPTLEAGETYVDAGTLQPLTGEQTIVVELPPVFWEDHANRGCPSGIFREFVGKSKKTIRVVVDRAAFDDILSDARHYSSDYDRDFFGLASSARATVRRLEKIDVVETDIGTDAERKDRADRIRRDAQLEALR